jgi:transposase InsO family protein
MVVEIVESMKKRTGIPYGMICKTLHLPLASFNRWRCRIREDVVLIKRPGPKKVEPFDPSVLDTEIRLLDHGVKRSMGTIQLYRRYHHSVSRRELGQMVERVRQDLEVDRQKQIRRIEWLMPGVVWAMDFTQYDLGMAGKIYLHNTQDLGSRYKFLPMAGGYPLGEEVAGYLSEKFDRYGAPLVLKRDNEGNMNHLAINDVLAESFVLPLNSPGYYAPYNGAIEESQREVKRSLREKLVLGLADCRDHVAAYAEAAVNDLNHRIRPCLNGRTSCQVFFASTDKPVFKKRERRGIYDWVMERVERILLTMNQSGQAVQESAWRIAVESWLRSKGYIKVHINQKCHPISPPFLAHE